MTVVMGGSLFAATWKANSAALLAAESQDMIQAINDVEINLARSESAQRGFLLSHEPSLLRERDEAITLLGSAVAAISKLSAGKPALRVMLCKVRVARSQRNSPLPVEATVAIQRSLRTSS